MDTEYVYRGVWINWGNGPIKGATLTVSERDGGLLISFVATFVTVVGAQLWRVISFILHQTRSTSDPQDGLHHQQQAIFRNAPTPGGAAWSFLLETWYWRGRARHSIWRTLPWTLFGVLYLILFGVLSTFSSQVSKAVGSARLIHGDNCGFWVLDESDASNSVYEGYQQRMANESIVSSTYARACYGPNPNKLSCGTYPVPALEYTAERNASCPFGSGMCVYGDTAAFKLTTKALNSHYQLGINAPSSGRVDIYKEATCAPLIQRRTPLNGSATETGVGTEGDLFLRYFYGGIGENNYTYQYNTKSMNTRIAYTIYAVNSFSPHDADSAGWQPMEGLAVDNADVGLIFIAPNAVRFSTPVDDPVFGAHYEIPLSGGGSYYEADEYNVAIGCADTYQICNPNNDNKCSDKVGSTELMSTAIRQLDLNTFQESIVGRMQLALVTTSIYSQVVTRLAAALRASDTAGGIEQISLPANQWELEVSGWFESGLARLQFLTQEYATGPDFVPSGSHIWSPGKDGDLQSLAMCYSQMINDSQGTSSFSILGLAIVFAIGGLIILLSLVVDTVVGWLQTFLKKGVAQKQAWLQDDKLQMQRVVLERAGLGTWESRNGFPVTRTDERFRTFNPDDSAYPAASPVPPAYPTRTSLGGHGETVPNTFGHKDSDVFVREMPNR